MAKRGRKCHRVDSVCLRPNSLISYVKDAFVQVKGYGKMSNQLDISRLFPKGKRKKSINRTNWIHY